MRGRIALWLGLCLLCSMSHASELIPPERHFGFRPGDDYRLVSWESVRSYFRAVEHASSRVKVFEAGRSSEDRPYLLAVISSAEKIARLDQYRDWQHKLADPRLLKDADEERRIVSQSKPVVVITCSLHSDEPASTLMALELLHQLAGSNDRAIAEILDGTIVLLVPSANPDGIDKVKNWYDRSRGKPWEGGGMPELYHRYAGHDTNRDWFMLNLEETRILTRLLYKEWFPTVLHDVHQMGHRGARIFVPPYHDPINLNVDRRIFLSSAMLGAGMAASLAAEGKRGVLRSAIYDDWWNGGNRTTPGRHNIVSVLTETASANLASPVFVRKADLLGGAKGFPDHRPAANFVDPWPGGWWRLRDAVDYQLICTRSLLALTARYHREFQSNLLALARDAIARGRTEPPRAWLVPQKQRDPATAAMMVRILHDSGIEVHRAVREFGAEAVTYPAGTWVLRANQPYRAHLKDLMERQVYPARFDARGAPEAPYDVTGWTLPLLMGVRTVTLDGPFTADTEKLDRIESPAGAVLRPESRPDPLEPMRRRRVAVYQPWVPSIDEGWTRYVLDRFHVPYQTVHNAKIRAGDLALSFDVLVLPSVDPRVLRAGFASGQTEPDYVGGLGHEGAAALQAFIREGGTLVCLEDSCSYVIDVLDLPVRNVLQGLSPSQFFGPGSIVELVLDPGHRLCADMPPRCMAAFDRSLAFDIVPRDLGPASQAKIVARYASSRPLASGWMLGPEKIEGKAALVIINQGKGQVILFAFPPQYRGQTHGTLPLFFSAVLGREAVPESGL